MNFLPLDGPTNATRVRTSCISISGRNHHSGELTTDLEIQQEGGVSSCVARCEQMDSFTSCERVWRNGYPSCYIENKLPMNAGERHLCWVTTDGRNGKHSLL